VIQIVEGKDSPPKDTMSPSIYGIPFNKPGLVGKEQEYVFQAMTSGHISGDGAFTRRCQALLEGVLGVPRVLLSTSCTDALEMTALLLDIQPGDEVIMPSFTFVSTANAYVLRGANPVFGDISPDTLNLNEDHLESLITPRTKAIVLVHYAGVGCELDNIMEIADRHGVRVVEDNAHGLFGRYRGQYLGTFGTLATQSFHETKNFTCGEGGALLINDPEFIERAEIVREKGTDRSQFFRGQVDKYTWIDIGSSFLPSDLLAAFLLAQLEERDKVQVTRKRIWESYYQGLQDWADSLEIQLPEVPDHCEQPFHMFYLLMQSFDQRQSLIRYLKENGILAVFHYLPLHLSRMGRGFGGRAGDCPVTEDISNRLLRLPFYNDFSPSEQARVIDVITAFH
jgi:dTDP-4-amino-4,6-dideoxygalactose transaminase